MSLLGLVHYSRPLPTVLSASDGFGTVTIGPTRYSIYQIYIKYRNGH
ncbi:hypothetical protein L1283_001973 [Sphingobacterium sp. HSC-15S19]